ncbi:MAG: hypothetical protein ACI9JN_002778 [Bacteroidia bacterium]
MVNVSNWRFRMMEYEKTKENATTIRSILNTIHLGVWRLKSFRK